MPMDTAPVSLRELAAERLARVRRALAAAGHDALIVSGAENVLYVTGYESLPAIINRTHRAAAVVTGTDLVLVAPSADFAPAIDAGLPAGDVVPFGTFFFSGTTAAATTETRHASFGSALVEALARLPARRALVEWAAVPDEAKPAISSWCDQVGEAAPWMLGVRGIKSPMEQAMLRHVGRMTERALEAGLGAAAPGVTDKEVASVVAAEMSRSGGLPRNVTVAGGLRSALADVVSTERPLARGDLLRFDIGCSYYGYKSDIARTAVIGEPDPLQRRRYRALLAGIETAVASARPGAVASEIFRRTVAAVEQGGLTPFLRHHVGHAIGLSVYEAPVITPDSEARLEIGATLCLETPYYEPGWGGMMVEDTGVVTENGFECFTALDRGLHVIPA